jgi:uncharacterized protein (TIGR02466 family)
MEHKICNLYCQPVTAIKLDVKGIAEFFETYIKPENPNPELNSLLQTNLANYHNKENIFELYPHLKSLEDNILKSANFVYQEILNHDSDLRITNAWINECGIGGEQGFHNHCNSVLSGTVYLKTNNYTNIQFLNKHLTSDIVNQIVDNPNQQKENKYGYYYHREIATFNVGEGDCLIWPSYLKHGYTNNQTPGRLSLSFNLVPTNLNCLYKS